MDDFELDITSFIESLNHIYQTRIPIYNTDSINETLGDVDLIGLFNERSHIGVSDMNDLSNYLMKLKNIDKKVFNGEVKNYDNGIPKTWDEQDFV